MCSCQCTACTNFNNTNLAIPTALSVWGFTAGQGLELYFPGIILCCVDNLQFQGFGSKPFHSVYISWYGKQLITIISDLVPSKKQISGIGATSLIGGASSRKGPSIYDVHTEGRGGQAKVDACGRGVRVCPMWTSRQKNKIRVH